MTVGWRLAVLPDDWFLSKKPSECVQTASFSRMLFLLQITNQLVIPAQAGIHLSKFSLLILKKFMRRVDSGLRRGSIADLRSQWRSRVTFDDARTILQRSPSINTSLSGSTRQSRPPFCRNNQYFRRPQTGLSGQARQWRLVDVWLFCQMIGFSVKSRLNAFRRLLFLECFFSCKQPINPSFRRRPESICQNSG